MGSVPNLQVSLHGAGSHQLHADRAPGDDRGAATAIHAAQSDEMGRVGEFALFTFGKGR